MTTRVFERRYEFQGGYPTRGTVELAHDDATLDRAIQSYRFFYSTVSGAAIFKGLSSVGVRANERFGFLDTKPRHVGYTLNSDTPYGTILLDMTGGPMVIELPPGPLIGAALDIHQNWIADIGIPGPDSGLGGMHLLLPPAYLGELPPGYHTARCSSYRVLVAVRSLPVGGDVRAATDRLLAIEVHPLIPTSRWTDPTWTDMTPEPQETTPHPWEDSFRYWEVLHEVVSSEPVIGSWRAQYGELAALGIARGQPFDPDARIKHILTEAARIGCGQMRVQAFADRRPDRVVWKDRTWEWASLRYENGSFDTRDYMDTYAREKWFFQAIATSPAMFRRDAGAGSLYWLGLRDNTGAYLDGARTYKLTVPQPVPAKLFWSVTAYDAETRSQVATSQGKAALRSLFELKDKMTGATADLYFGPEPPHGHEGQWIKTLPGKGWFAYFRIYGPERPAFDGSWKPGDFEVIR